MSQFCIWWGAFGRNMGFYGGGKIQRIVDSHSSLNLQLITLNVSFLLDARFQFTAILMKPTINNDLITLI